MSIRGVIFDFGGVITNMRWDVARKLEREHGLERNIIARSLFASDEWREIQVGKGDLETWRAAAHRRLEESAGKSLPPLHVQWRTSVELIKENVELIRALRPPYLIAILSNADLTLEDRIRNGLGIEKLFDTIISSAVVGMAKPDHAIYRLAAERLSLPTEECVFIDDTEGNVEAARAVGMAGVHYREHEGDDLKAQLAELGVQPSGP